jgi:hypothetical protein
MRMAPVSPRRMVEWLVTRARSAGRVPKRTLPLVGAVLLAVGLLPAASQAQMTSTQTTFLTKVGPVSPDNGYPTYYQDSNNVRLQPCLDESALCGGLAATPIPDPTQPVSFPGNFPDEFFYFLSQATINLPGGGNALFVGALEGAFNTGTVQNGQQITFARIRIRIDAPSAGTYTITHPFGVDTFDVTAPGVRSINFTEDIGISSGRFDGALTGRVDPFLTWDTGMVTDASGATYVGDPNVNHAVTGSPFNTNFFKIDGPDIGGVGVNTISTNLFSLTGKVATNSGLDPGHPTYSRSDTTGGMVDVVANTDPGKAVKAKLPGDVSTTSLRGDASGNYVARLPFTGATPPSTVTVSNVSDTPDAVFSMPVTDLVLVTDATYDADAQTLTVTAASSDQAAPPVLTAKGFGALSPGTQTLSPATTSTGTSMSLSPPTLAGTVTVGTQTFTGVAAPPESVTVTSSAGGSASRVVQVAGAAFPNDPVSADAGPDQSVQQGQTVTLDGSASLNYTSLAWTQLSGPTVTLTGADTAKATFTAPNTAVQMEFQLTAQGPGGPSTDTVLITVQPVTAPVADAGPDQNVLVGNTVVLDGTASTGASTFAWTQASGPAVTLTGADTARPTFVMPAAGSTALVFTLTVTGPGGSASDQVSIRAIPDVLTVTRAEYRSGSLEWRFDGTSSILDNNLVTVYLGSGTSGPVIGTALVDTTGAWSVRARNSSIVPNGNTTATIQSSRGGLLTITFTSRT